MAESMSEEERAIAIAAHGAAHEKKIIRRWKQRIAADERKKRRGLDAAIERLKAQDHG